MLELKPGFARAYEARGLAHDDLGDRDKALADLDEAIKHDGSAWQLAYSRAVVRRADGDTEGALRDLDAAGDLKADATNVPLMRALILADQGSYEAARAEINRVLSDGRGGASAHYARAAVAFEEGRIDAAEDDVDHALDLDGDFAAAHMLKGRILEERATKSAARTRFDKALATAADSFDGRTTRRVAKQRLSVLGTSGKVADKRTDDVADVSLEEERAARLQGVPAGDGQRRHRQVQRVAPAQTSSSTQTGTWSDGFSQARVKRSTPAATSRSAACGDSSRWSMRMPSSFWQAPA